MSAFPSPFGDPHPRARAAAEALAADVRRDETLARALYAPNGGKMFGVLVVRDATGSESILRACSGQLDGRWLVPGFAGPAFDLAARDAFWIDGEASLGVFADEIATLTNRRRALEDQLAPIAAAHGAARAIVADRHRANKARRTAERTDANREALANESRRDSAELQRLLDAQRLERAPLADELARIADGIARLERARTARSRELLLQIQETYRFANAHGDVRSLREIFAPAEPPGGAGDCAAPKLFAEAYRRGLAPIALAEIWIGAPPATGDRVDGHCYPACRGKCGPILGHVLQGLAVEPAPVYVDLEVRPDEPRTVYEDAALVVVEKPVGLLSVPGRGDALRDSVLVRLRDRYPDATGPLIVHRLDLDTSGLLLVAKDEATHKSLQAQFARREIDKRYIAILDGLVPDTRDAGTIELPLRVDIDDRPRQIYDPIHGKAAITEWSVLERDRQRHRTRIAFVPRTGRTHQLRVHAAHPLGLGIPIVGDRLYGRASTRLHLHATAIAFVHPRTGERLAIESPDPF